MIHPPRKIEPTQDEWIDVLDTALEHATHAWYALESEGKVKRVNPNLWPPNVENTVGSAPYHFASFITYVVEVFRSISNAPENNIAKEIAEKQTPISRILRHTSNWLLKLSEHVN